MNERIKLLEKQCWDLQTNHLDSNKFAQAIIQDCIEALRLVPYGANSIEFGDEMIYQDAIRNHFGIVE